MIPKKPLIMGSIIFVVLIGLIFLLYFLKENRYVTFTIDYPDGSAILSDPSDTSKKFATIHNGSALWLSKRSYAVLFENDKLDKNPTTITVTDQTGTIKLDPNFSRETLQHMFTDEQATLNATIKASVTSSQPYTLDNGTLYHHGEWYGTQLHVYKASSEDPDIGNPGNVDTFYLVLKKENNSWKVVAGPSLILTKPDNPTIPSYIIDALNPVNAAF
jgi:hypothetical protein